MKIYTKTGDEGQTGLYGGERVSKDHIRIHAYGTLDELNATLGIVISGADVLPKAPAQFLRARLTRIQAELFRLGAELATPRNREVKSTLIAASDIELLEQEIDQMEESLPPLKNFILPGGSSVGAMVHLARTVCRRAERELISFNRGESTRSETLKYVNRLSDYLFVTARWANQQMKVPETPWLG